jgi:hypothetical protein
MDVVIIEEAGNIHAAGTKFLHRIDGAGGAAYVEEYLHDRRDSKSFSGEKQTVFA